MKYISIILTLSFFLTGEPGFGQELHFGYHLVNEDSTLSRNNIKSLTVKNCIGSSCMEVNYEFNSLGLITKLAPAIINPYSTWEYYPDGRIKAKYSKNHCCDSDTIFSSTHYEYGFNDNLKYVIYRSYKNGMVIKEDTLDKEKEVDLKNYPTIRNEIGQVIEQTLTDLYYPCGIVFKGTHRIRYHYLDNGLIDYGKIYNDQGELIVDLKYEYEKEIKTLPNKG
ncbi:hypothetical protein [Croceimicrobium sp.]|uniref:hypothetical protein n=1 Tax=Croceimicrobium sp. TaxID=2828340 RepID=UPI003BACE6EE